MHLFYFTLIIDIFTLSRTIIMKRFILSLLTLLSLTTAILAQSSDPIPVNEAFQLTATAKDYQTILLNWQIAPNYYLYKKHFKFQAIKPKNTILAEPLYPAGEVPLKTALGTYQVYPDQVTIVLPVIHSNQKNVLLEVHYQGCSHSGYCYPPQNKMVLVNLAGNYMHATRPLNIDIPTATVTKKPKEAKTPSSKINNLLNGHSTWLMILGFFGFGLLISLTPCVLPMIPILSSMIIGQKKMTHTHAFLLSLFYVLGMALTYAIAGVLFGFLGSSIQAAFQKPWIILAFSLLFVAMALSLFGFFNIQLPEKLRTRLSNTSNHQKKGTYIGALVMGCLSTLILSPCVTPPLVAVLGYISQTGNAALGGIALFVMGIGMGFPLLLIGALGPKFIPKSGLWMNTVKNLMGILMLGLAVFMASRALPAPIIMLLWAALCLGTALYLGALSSTNSRAELFKKVIGLVIFIYGVLLINGAYIGKTSPLSIFEKPQTHTNQTSDLKFHIVHSLTETKQLIAQAKPNQPVMLDFYANWCVACHELDKLTFNDPAVQKELSSFLLIRADVTKNTDIEKALEKHYKVVAPPTIIFFKNGKEVANTRIIGFAHAKKMLSRIRRVNSQ